MPKSTPQPRLSEPSRSPSLPAVTLARPLQASSGKAATPMRDARSRDECHCDDGPERLSPRAARNRW
jgi:hypothetical protein